MTRRTVGLLVTLTLLVAPLAAQAQPPGNMPRIGILSHGSPPAHPRAGAPHASPAG
jgi:hypothetical protein